MAANKIGDMEVEQSDKKTNDTANTEELPPELLIKHPLQNIWTLWYYENDRNRSWEENQREITSFDTVEDFWGLYNHIKAASDLRQGCDYSLFKKGVRPMWEDDANKQGGRWLINLEKKQRSLDLDNFWLEVSDPDPKVPERAEPMAVCNCLPSDETTCSPMESNPGPLTAHPQLLCLIGEAFDEFSDDVCGAVVNIRSKGDKIGVWTADASKGQSVMEIGRRLKERLNISAKVIIGYQIHKDTMNKSGSVTKNTYTI